jgi:hypothetical protein
MTERTVTISLREHEAMQRRLPHYEEREAAKLDLDAQTESAGRKDDWRSTVNTQVRQTASDTSQD